MSGPYHAAMLAAHSYTGLLDCSTAAWVDGVTHFWVPDVSCETGPCSWLAAEQTLEERVPQRLVIKVLEGLPSK